MQKQVCSCCGQTISQRKETLSLGIVRSFFQAAKFINSNKFNRVHPRKDLNLSTSGYNNFQKLRYHGLVAKFKDAPGNWLITRRGYQFLNNEIEIPKWVWILNNRIVDRGDKLIYFRDIAKIETPYFMSMSTMEYRN